MSELENKIRKKLADADLGVTNFAEKIGITPQGLGKIFKNNDCKWSLIKKMCAVLNCSPNDLIA